MRGFLWISVVVFLTLFLFECLYQCSAMLSLIVRVLVPLLIRISISFSLSLSVSGNITGKSACIRTSLDSYFFVSLSLWMRVAVSDYIMTDCRCKCTHLDSCFWLFFSECFYPCSSILTLILVGESVNASLDLRLSLSLSLCLCQCPSILSVICMYVSKRVQLTQWATALWKIEFLFFYFACIRTSLDFCFFLSLFVWMSVPVSRLIVWAYTSLLRVSYSFTLWISVLVFGYIETHCTCICTSLHPYLSLFSLWMPL